MLNLEIKILSKETIKPSSPEIHKKAPFKICLFDQLTPSTYNSTIWFYSSIPVTNDDHILAHLKTSLSKTLNILYPFSGRLKDNLFIHDFQEGVPFSSARINCRMSDFLKHQQIEWMNKLVPCQPFQKETDVEILPLMVCQVTMFACGGIALGLCTSHKIIDAKTGWIIANVWSKVARGNVLDSIPESFNQASVIFPPKNPMPENYISMMEKLWFTEGNYITRRFTFDALAISKLKSMVKGTRTEVVSGFIWKYSMAASRAVSKTPKPSIVVQAVNLRHRGKTNPLSDAIGNLFWWASALSNPAESGTGLPELVDLMRDSIAAFDDEYISSMQGEKGFEAIAEYFNQLEMMFSVEKPDIFAFTSWLNLGFNRMDLGWGPPCSFALFGKVGPAFRNLAVLVEAKCGNGIEAWITMNENRMSVLEKDTEFLKLASPHWMISSL